MRMIEYDLYKAYYCGLCKTMGKRYGFISRFTLSYDFVFLSLMQTSLSDSEQTFKREACLFNPLKKKLCCKAENDLEFASDVAMIMLYYKIKDNIADEPLHKKLLYILLLPFAASARKKAAANLPEFDEILKNTMQEQYLCESSKCDVVDKACEPTAKALEQMFSHISEDEVNSRILGRMGYFLGRYVYMCDALDDILEDYKDKKYNPFLLSKKIEFIGEEAKSEIIEESKGDLYMNIAEIIKAYELLPIIRNKEILDNIIYFGLKAMVNRLKYEKEQSI